MSNNLYTIIFDYRGGTYISQVSGDSPGMALAKWESSISEGDLAKWKLARPELARLSQDSPVPLDRCLNVWSTSSSTKAGLMLVNIVATERGVRQER